MSTDKPSERAHSRPLEGLRVLEIDLRLLPTIDIIVENLRPGAMDRLGLGYETLREVNTRLIYCAISGYGRLSSHRGKYADRPAFDTAVQATGGLMSVTGQRDGP